MSYEEVRRPSIFWYHAYSLGIGGWVEVGGTKYPIPSFMPGALSAAGGETTIESDGFLFEKGFFSVSVKSASTKLSTEETETDWITHVTTTLKGFNLCRRVGAETIVASLTSTHKKQIDRKKPKKERAKISFGDSSIEG